MAKGISLHIGLNSVDPLAYEGWSGDLAACEFDAKDMKALAAKQGFTSSTVLLTKKATADAVLNGILAASAKLKSGDIFFLTYSGHGGQVKDKNGDEEDDRMDETWCLYDREVIDDELYALYSKFAAGVRILVLSDSCHSGTVMRMRNVGPRKRFMPPAIGKRVYEAHKAMYDGIQRRTKASEKTTVKASGILISGCMDNQESSDGDRNGLFTGTMKAVWANGKFKRNYRSFRDAIVARMPSDQTPNYFTIGKPSPAFEAQRPFTV
ncbi:MAG: caspase family protein [Flavobacteriales bacterium]|nr:caspase family protein [Flavobacteriales bacterium]